MNPYAESSVEGQESDRSYDICVLGTSNALIHDGYVAQLSEEKAVRSLINLSIGGSSSNLFTYRRPDIAGRRFDAVIVDFCVNDTSLYYAGLQNPLNIEQSLEEIICGLSSQGGIPVIFILPMLYYGNNPVPDIYRDVAKRFQVPVFDGYKAAKTISVATGLAYGELFEDPLHLKRPLSRCLASWMIGAFDTYRRSLARPIPRQHDIATTRYVAINQVSRTPLPRVERSTSLIREIFSEIDDETAVDVELPEDRSIVAIVADFANSAGILCLSGSDCLRICLSSFELVAGGDGLVVKVWPLPRPVFPIQGSVRLNVVSDHEGGFDVGLGHPLSEEQKQMTIKINLAGLIVRSAGQTICAYRSPCTNADLSEVDAERFVALARSCLIASAIA